MHLVLQSHLTTSAYYLNGINVFMPVPLLVFMQCLTGGDWRGLQHQLYTPMVTAVINVGAVMQNHALETMSLITPIKFVHGREAGLVIITM